MGFCVPIEELNLLVCYITRSCLDYKEGSEHQTTPNRVINNRLKPKLITEPEAVREMAPGNKRNFLNLMKIYSQLDESWA